MKFINKLLTNKHILNIVIVLTLFLPLQLLLNCIGLTPYYFIIVNSFKPCLLKWLLYFSLTSSYPNISIIVRLYISTLLASLLLGTFFSDIMSLYITLHTIPTVMYINDVMAISNLLSPTPYNHLQWMGLTERIRICVQLKIDENISNNIRNRTLYLRDISKFLTPEERAMLRSTPNFPNRTSMLNLQVHGKFGIREDNLARIRDNY